MLQIIFVTKEQTSLNFKTFTDLLKTTFSAKSIIAIHASTAENVFIYPRVEL